jgi:hypothetical protein
MPTESKPLPNPRQGRSPDVQRIVAAARDALTAPRVVSPQVLAHLLAQYEVPAGEVSAWLRSDLGKLESYELDLVLSPLFTPDLSTRLRFERILGAGHLEELEVGALLGTLEGLALRMTLVIDADRVEAELPTVVLERFVRLMHLDSPLPEAVLADLDRLDLEARLCLRDKIWHLERNRSMLPNLLAAAKRTGEDFTETIHFVTDFLRTYRPATCGECVTGLEHLAQAYRDELDRYQSGSRSFFNPELQAAYRGKWPTDEAAVAGHKRLLATAEALRRAMS